MGKYLTYHWKEWCDLTEVYISRRDDLLGGRCWGCRSNGRGFRRWSSRKPLRATRGTGTGTPLAVGVGGYHPLRTGHDAGCSSDGCREAQQQIEQLIEIEWTQEGKRGWNGGEHSRGEGKKGF